jgi:glycosyltransferase involved in cell wall biosynthesis
MLGGGSVRDAMGLVEKLSGRFHFRVVTTDQDLGSRRPHEGIEAGRWLTREDHDVVYVRPAPAGLRTIWSVLREPDYDLIYLNSVFDRPRSIYPVVLRRLGLARRVPVIVAPRGQLSPGALELKRSRKESFLRLAAATGLYSDVTWHASSELEAREIRDALRQTGVSGPGGGEPVISIGRDLITSQAIPPRRSRASKRPGELKIAFVSRVTPKKNLRGAIRMLRKVTGKVDFTVYGPLEDQSYWRECEKEARALPDGIRVLSRGPIPHEDVWKAFSESDLFLFPTLGESFGFVIAEALQAGCPVLITDRTPWQGLEARGAGWDVPLENEGRFVEILQRCVDLHGESLDRLSAAAYEFGRTLLDDSEEIEANRRVIENAFASARSL